MAEENKNLISALIAARKEMGPIIKDRSASIPTSKGGVIKYSYADLSDVIDVIYPVLLKHGLVLTQHPGVGYTDSPSIVVYGRLFHESGEEIDLGNTPIFMPQNADARAVGSAISYARRYQLLAALGLAAEDDDGAEASAPVPDSELPLAANYAKKKQAQPSMPHPTYEEEDIPFGGPPAKVVGWYDEWKETAFQQEGTSRTTASAASLKFANGLIDKATGEEGSWSRVFSTLARRPVHSGNPPSQGLVSWTISQLNKSQKNRDTGEYENNPNFNPDAAAYVRLALGEAKNE